MNHNRKKYDKEFKQKEVELSYARGNSKEIADELGVEQPQKHFGNECNVMAEIILSRYYLFISKGIPTHLTTNLSVTEIEDKYGNRVRSRMREMFNLVAFDKNTGDKRSYKLILLINLKVFQVPRHIFLTASISP